MRGKISTVIPVFLDSGLPFEIFTQTIDHVMKQSVLPTEIIISDDSSSRLIEDWLREIEDDTRVSFVYIRNTGSKGVSGNSNFGAVKARGEFIHFLHSDDLIASQFAYEDALKALSSGEKSWLLFGGETNGATTIPELDNLNLFGINSVGGPSAIFIRSEAFDFFDEKLSMLMDIEFYKRTLSKYGPPEVLRSVYLRFGFGDWQIQNNISMGAIQNELEYLSLSGVIGKSDFLHLLGFTGLSDFKIRGLKVMKVTSQFSEIEYLCYRFIIYLQIIKFRFGRLLLRFKIWG